MYDKSNETSSNYYETCFVTIQNAIDRAFMLVKLGNKTLPTTNLRRFPYPSVTYDMFLADFAVHAFPFFVVLAFFYTTKTIIRVSLII